AHADALVDAEAAALDDAFLEAPAFVPRDLEVQVAIVDLVAADRAQRLLQRRLVEPTGLEQEPARERQPFDRGFARDHRVIVGARAPRCTRGSCLTEAPPARKALRAGHPASPRWRSARSYSALRGAPLMRA